MNTAQVLAGVDLRIAICDYIDRYERDHQYAPTVRELAERFDRSTSSIWRHLILLREAGLVNWVDNQERTVHVTGRWSDGA